MKVLVINCGSSSLKFRLMEMDDESILAKGLCERIGSKFGHFRYEPTNAERLERDCDLPDHDAAVKMVIETLISEDHGVIESVDEIDAVGHRIVHGGDKFSGPACLTPEVIRDIEDCSALAPIHNPVNLMGIRACQKYMPNVHMAGVFDTAFHHTLPEEAYLYGIPYEYYKKYKIRRYGFHGMSHEYVARRTAEVMGVPFDRCKQVVCHLGNGASITAVKNGKSVDTSMGYTPLEGIIMGTRSGSIDPEIINVIAKKEKLDTQGVMDVLNYKSGVYGLSDFLSSDIRDLTVAYGKNDPNAIRALNTYVYAIVKYIGAYVTVLEGVDSITFTAGVGEHSAFVRKLVCEKLSFLGVKLNDVANDNVRGEALISLPDSHIRVYVIPTDEELSIARQTAALVEEVKSKEANHM
ncbi:acetate/propionate family kinase [Lachnospiraceae bacterium YH-ros2226]